MDIVQKDVEMIVQQVLKNILPNIEQVAASSQSSNIVKTYKAGTVVSIEDAQPKVAPVHIENSINGDYGVFETMAEAVDGTEYIFDPNGVQLFP